MSAAAADRAWTMPAAAGLAALEATALVAVLIARGSRSAPILVACTAVKYPFCALLARRRPGAWFALVLWELTGVYAAVAAPRVPVVLRALELALAGGVLTLLAMAVSSFPRVELPE